MSITEQALKSEVSHRERFLKGVAEAAHVFLSDDGVKAAAQEALRIIGKAAGVDCACVFRVQPPSQRREARTRVWLSWERGEEAEAWEPGTFPPDGILDRWHDLLQERTVLRGTPEDFPASERAVLEQREVASVLMLPVFVGGQYWGALRLDACRRARRWTPGEVDALEVVTQSLEQVLQRQITASAVPEEEETTEGLSRVDRALIDVSRLLVSHRNFAVKELLKLIGEALDAAHVYLTTVPPDESSGKRGGKDPLKTIQQARKHYTQSAEAGGWPSFDEYTYHEWRAPFYDGQEEVEDAHWASSLAIPILSEADQLYGYLGIEYEAGQYSRLQKNRRVLNVLGDMLATYLERQLAGAALRKSEERYRAFVRTIVEGIWCIEIDPPVGTEGSLEEQLRAFRQHGVVVECNANMAKALGQSGPEDVIGQSATAIVPESFEGGLFRDFIANDYNLRDREYTLHHEGKDPQHFVANVIGTVEQGRLVRIWGSWTDVTERVELERRMVTTLEQQQERIGRELHDGVGQLMTSISMLGQNLVEQYLSEEKGGHERAQKIVRFAQEGARLVRELQRGLAPVQAYDGGLVDALMELARNTDGLPEVTCAFEHDGKAELQDREERRQLYRIAQEATNNALKHAAPAAICISFRMEGNQPVLQVKDDGCGFDATRQTDQSLGLHSMRYRARSIGAVLTVDSKPGEGTTIRCVLPPEGTRSAAS